MKKFILPALLFSSIISFAKTDEDTMPAKISEINRIEISNSQNQPVFFWEVKTIAGVASGYTDSLLSAQRTIKLMATSDAVTYKVIEMYN